MEDSESVWYHDPTTITALYNLAISNGIIKRVSADVARSSEAGTISVLAAPSLFPTELFSLAQVVQSGFNSLVDSVSRQHDFLAGSLANVLKTDDFTRKLFEIYEETRRDNKQTCALGIHRCDYMVDRADSGELAIKQIEINTIACSLSSFGTGLRSFHRYVCSRYAGKENVNLPDNPALTNTTDAVALAWKELGNRDAVVLFVSASGELNIYDHRLIEYDLWTRYSVKCLRKTLTEIYHEGSLGPHGELMISGTQCAVVYFRAGYSPSDYPTEKEWKARLLLEQSTASCCPSAAYQLVGTKKIQQRLASPGVLEQFVKDPEMMQNMKSTFAGLYTLDRSEEGDRVVDMALKYPDRYVLKPQREGGGNNFYGNDVRKKLEEIRETSEREAFILMDRVRPPAQLGLILKPRPHTLQLEPEPVLGELGIFGVYVRRGDQVLLNRSGGHCLRTKSASSDEGGVGVGASSLDSPSLVTSQEFISSCIINSNQ